MSDIRISFGLFRRFVVTIECAKWMISLSTYIPHPPKKTDWHTSSSTTISSFWVFPAVSLDIQTPAENVIWTPKIYGIQKTPNLRRYDCMPRVYIHRLSICFFGGWKKWHVTYSPIPNGGESHGDPNPKQKIHQLNKSKFFTEAWFSQMLHVWHIYLENPSSVWGFHVGLWMSRCLGSKNISQTAVEKYLSRKPAWRIIPVSFSS